MNQSLHVFRGSVSKDEVLRLRDSKLKKDDEIGDAGAEHGSEIRSGEREESMTRQRRQVSEIIKNNFKISLVSHR